MTEKFHHSVHECLEQVCSFQMKYLLNPFTFRIDKYLFGDLQKGKSTNAKVLDLSFTLSQFISFSQDGQTYRYKKTNPKISGVNFYYNYHLVINLFKKDIPLVLVWSLTQEMVLVLQVLVELSLSHPLAKLISNLLQYFIMYSNIINSIKCLCVYIYYIYITKVSATYKDNETTQ